MRWGKNKAKTADWYTWEIARLEKVNMMLESLKAVRISTCTIHRSLRCAHLASQNPPDFTGMTDETQKEKDARTKVSEKMGIYFRARKDYQNTPA